MDFVNNCNVGYGMCPPIEDFALLTLSSFRQLYHGPRPCHLLPTSARRQMEHVSVGKGNVAICRNFRFSISSGAQYDLCELPRQGGTSREVQELVHHG